MMLKVLLIVLELIVPVYLGVMILIATAYWAVEKFFLPGPTPLSLLLTVYWPCAVFRPLHLIGTIRVHARQQPPLLIGWKLFLFCFVIGLGIGFELGTYLRNH